VRRGCRGRRRRGGGGRGRSRSRGVAVPWSRRGGRRGILPRARPPTGPARSSRPAPLEGWDVGGEAGVELAADVGIRKEGVDEVVGGESVVVFGALELGEDEELDGFGDGALERGGGALGDVGEDVAEEGGGRARRWRRSLLCRIGRGRRGSRRALAGRGARRRARRAGGGRRRRGRGRGRRRSGA
jgi:hypothetical protein